MDQIINLEKQSISTIALGKTFLDEFDGNGSHTQPYKVLARIFDYACDSDTPTKEDGTVLFSWRDIKKDEDEADDGHKLKRAIRDSVKRWKTHHEALNQYAFDKGLKHYPVIELFETGGGSGNLTKHMISFKEVEPSYAVDKQSLPKGYIGYTAECADTSNKLIRFVDGLTAKGINFFLLVGTLATVLILAFLVFWGGVYLLGQQTTTYGLIKTILNTGIFIGGLYLVFSPLHKCLTKRIIIAPVFLSYEDYYSSQIEYIPTGELDQKGKKIRQFRVVSYTGKCSICGGRIDVENGSGALSGRLVGRCSESPTEHAYTFDPETKIGKLIYDEYLEIEGLRKKEST